jgi:microcystin-dependent protein
MSQPFIGQIIAFAGSFAPRNWQLCNGQLLPIQQYQALFSIIGTTYGGNGTTNFQLPDLRGRAAVSAGQGLGLSTYVLGEQNGAEQVTISQGQLPRHTHLISVNNDTTGTATAPGGNYISSIHETRSTASSYETYATAVSTQNTLNPSSVQQSGSSLPVTIIPPVLAINYIICIFGTYPSRN